MTCLTHKTQNRVRLAEDREDGATGQDCVNWHHQERLHDPRSSVQRSAASASSSRSIALDWQYWPSEQPKTRRCAVNHLCEAVGAGLGLGAALAQGSLAEDREDGEDGALLEGEPKQLDPCPSLSSARGKRKDVVTGSFSSGKTTPCPSGIMSCAECSGT